MATFARLLLRTIESAAPLPEAVRRCERLVVVGTGGAAADPAEIAALFPVCRAAWIVSDHVETDALPPTHDGATRRADEEADGGLRTCLVPWRSGGDGAGGRGFDPAAARAIRSGAPRVAAFLRPLDEASGRMLLDLRRCGIRTFAFEEAGRWRVVSAARAILSKVAPRPWTDPSRRSDGHPHDREPLAGFSDETSVERFLTAMWRLHADSASRGSAANGWPGSQPRRIWHYISSLDPGGAERQVVNLAGAQCRAGLDARVLTTLPLVGERAHYRPLLAARGVEARTAGIGFTAPEFEPLRSRILAATGALRAVPADVRIPVFDLYGELLRGPLPDVLHCWLDGPNVHGAVAGLFAGVPRVVLSVRNVNPTHFPELDRPWMRPWYAALARTGLNKEHTELPTRLAFIANSRFGAADYARWLGIPVERIAVIPNGLDDSAFEAPPPAEVAALRRSLGLEGGEPLIAGVFRLSEEKRPEDFVRAVARVRHAIPNVQAVIVGVGPLEQRVRQAIRQARIEGVVRLLGRREDVKTILVAADVVLHTSAQEGMPNVIMEALALGRPIVATAAGGTAELVEDGRTGYLCPVGDIAPLATRVAYALEAGEEARAMGSTAARFARGAFSMTRVHRATLGMYGAMTPLECTDQPAQATTL